MKHHHVLDDHKQNPTGAPQYGDVTGWARGRSMPAINTKARLTKTVEPRTGIPTKGSLAASLYRKQRLKKINDAEHAEEVRSGMREAKAMSTARPTSSASVDHETTISTGEFFAKLYAGNIDRTRKANTSKQPQ